MRKQARIALIAVALFFSAQLFVAQHEAHFGLEKHTHHGEPCQIQLFADHLSAAGLPSAPLLPITTMLLLAVSFVCRAPVVSLAYRASAPRAPPISIA